jgi:hypothetical protein
MQQSQKRSPYKQDSTKATLLAGDALRAEYLEDARWFFDLLQIKGLMLLIKGPKVYGCINREGNRESLKK